MIWLYKVNVGLYIENFIVKNVDDKIEDKFNNYVLENVNTLIKSNVKYSNCELFNEGNISEMRKKYNFTFDTIIDYLNSNTNVQGINLIIFLGFMIEENNKLIQKIRFLNSNNPEVIVFLRELIKNYNQFAKKEWVKLKEIKQYENLLKLEKFGLISIRNIDEIRFLNPTILELISKL